jgi:pimeloyl-ACP methyl ester carboxylesterase
LQRSIHITRTDGLPLEYSVIDGNESPLLIMHGGHSDCREELGYSALARQGHRIITPSRPGYGFSSPALGDSLSRACRAYCSLLDELGIERVHVIAVSAGGLSGIYFAGEHPDRVASLTLQSAISKPWLNGQNLSYSLTRVLFHPRFEKFTWAMTKLLNTLSPLHCFKMLAPSLSVLPFKHIAPCLDDNAHNQFARMIQRQRSRLGFALDIQHSETLTPDHLRAVRCRTLIQHSVNDQAVSPDHARHAHRFIAGSKLQLLDSWGHLIWIGRGSEEVDREVLAFLQLSK